MRVNCCHSNIYYQTQEIWYFSKIIFPVMLNFVSNWFSSKWIYILNQSSKFSQFRYKGKCLRKLKNALDEELKNENISGDVLIAAIQSTQENRITHKYMHYLWVDAKKGFKQLTILNFAVKIAFALLLWFLLKYIFWIVHNWNQYNTRN